MANSGSSTSSKLMDNGAGDGTKTKEDLTADALMSSEYNIPITLMEKRHVEKILGTKKCSGAWRMKERMKTVSVALVLCLNVGVDPPDVLKIQPCAREECWIDPLAMGPKKALEAIGSQLQKQYERWQPRARSKLSLDPTLDEVKKLCQSLRRNAKEERVLFHYNGHGVPKPTDNGEIWVFNKNYTQYIPLSLYTLQSWMSMPSIYVFDCSNAGLILDKFTEFQQTRDVKMDMSETGHLSSNGASTISYEACRQCILLGACSTTELLPQDPNLPADLFTSCLTTPISMALRWYVLQTSGKLVKGITKELIDNIPGALNDRRTMLGELNWIFTAITDTIAWNVLPRETFQKLFRQDLLVASLFRNFLLAERIMRSYNCTPVSNQRLPSTYQHPMWQAWDFTLDACLSQLPAISKKQAEFQYSSFFAEQLTAFQVWLEYGGMNRNPPEQLPIVLQVLLSQVHRLRALDLLSRFLDHGPKAVSLALSVGIFPYVLKLLQSSARELRPLLVFIWAKILSVDGSCQVDLVKDGGHKYFLHVLDDRDMPSEYRTMAAFVLAMIVKNHAAGQEAVYQGKAISICLLLLDYKTDHRLRAWCALCLGQIWQNFPVAKWAGVRDNAHEKLANLLSDDVPEVRCAALLALSTFINQPENRTEHAINLNHTVGIQICGMASDPSPMVREELLSGIAGFIAIYETQFICIALRVVEEEVLGSQLAGSPQKLSSPKSSPGGRLKSITGSPYSRDGFMTQASMANGIYGSCDSLDAHSPSCSPSTVVSFSGASMKRVPSAGTSLGLVNVYNTMWRTLLQLTLDPFNSVNQQAGIVVNLLKNKASSSSGVRPGGITIGSSERRISSSSSAASSPVVRNIPTTPNSRVQSPSRHSRPFKSQASVDKQEGATSEKMIDTEFFKWSCKLFEKSVMDEFCTHSFVTSDVAQEKQGMYADNVKVKVRALKEHLQAPYTPIETEVFANKMSTLPSLLRFHPYDIRLAVADSDGIGLWDWEAGVKLNKFYNHNSKTCRITGMEYLNPQEDDRSLLAVATDDGAVRIWKDFSSKSSSLELVTAWQAIPDTSFIKMTANSPGMIMEWQQSSTSMFFSGACKFIRIYDTKRESKVMDMLTGSDGCVTSLYNDAQNISLVMASCSDGSVRVFDSRKPSNSSRVCLFKHKSWVLNCQTLKGDGNSIVSACRSGDIKFWDLRNLECTGGLSVGSGLRSMTVHKQAELIACGVTEQMISIYNTAGDATSFIKYHEGFMGQRVAKVSCLAFHPHLVRLASGNVDGMVSVFMMSEKAK